MYSISYENILNKISSLLSDSHSHQHAHAYDSYAIHSEQKFCILSKPTIPEEKLVSLEVPGNAKLYATKRLENPKAASAEVNEPDKVISMIVEIDHSGPTQEYVFKQMDQGSGREYVVNMYLNTWRACLPDDAPFPFVRALHELNDKESILTVNIGTEESFIVMRKYAGSMTDLQNQA